MVEIRNPTTLRKSLSVATEAQGVVDDVANENEVSTKAGIVKLEGTVNTIEGKVTSILWMLSLIVVIKIGIFVKLFIL